MLKFNLNELRSILAAALIKDVEGITNPGEADRVIRALYPSKLQPIETAPKDGTYILVAGDSGYTTTPLRFEACRYDAEYRPKSPWITHSNDCFEDGGNLPKWWMPLPHAEDGGVSFECLAGKNTDFNPCPHLAAVGKLCVCADGPDTCPHKEPVLIIEDVPEEGI
ncbi:MAG: hypothetical protein GWN00_01495 [Aliifodinibius sp.]|nr:hypothetical protein [Phycisphaerae bacterium]NIR62354.1 hypothetical protein [candidate division Zixibacteria bacterium]NIT54953.1 hypothetical protein [Fodinibius sp.]NIW43365.1 hypothetical protein [Gammaproteobacteria bacterium]NIU12587.1 hypothetical protein [candidate division Zixibacteria bacterium]